MKISLSVGHAEWDSSFGSDFDKKLNQHGLGEAKQQQAHIFIYIFFILHSLNKKKIPVRYLSKMES